MKVLFWIITLFTCSSVFGQTTCKKCDVSKAQVIEIHEQNLTYNVVSEFLCTFDSVCNNNVEFSEYSNKILFRVLANAPELYFNVLENEKLDKNLFLRAIENPIDDSINLQEIYDKIKRSSVSNLIKSEYSNSILTAANKTGTKIKK